MAVLPASGWGPLCPALLPDGRELAAQLRRFTLYSYVAVARFLHIIASALLEVRCLLGKQAGVRLRNPSGTASRALIGRLSMARSASLFQFRTLVSGCRHDTTVGWTDL